MVQQGIGGQKLDQGFGGRRNYFHIRKTEGGHLPAQIRLSYKYIKNE